MYVCILFMYCIVCALYLFHVFVLGKLTELKLSGVMCGDWVSVCLSLRNTGLNTYLETVNDIVGNCKDS